MSAEPKFLFKADEIAAMKEIEGHHPLNPNSELHGVSLSGAAGLERIGFHRIRVPAGKESNEYHAHHFEEEFYFILSGRGIAMIDGEEYEVGPGDFMGFPAPSVAHLLRNPFEEDLVYLVGGERGAFEIGEFTRLGKMIIREGRRAWIVEKNALQEFQVRLGKSNED